MVFFWSRYSMSNTPKIDDFDDIDTDFDDSVLPDDDESTSDVRDNEKKNPKTRQQIDDLLEKKRLERELRDSYDDLDDFDDFDDFDDL